MKSLAVGIVFLFIFSTITPLVIGYDVEIANREFMDDLAFDCYDECHSSKVLYYREHLLRNYSNDGDVELEGCAMPVEISATLRSGGPMDSPWPMKSHDLHHTGLSPYSTIDNDGTEKWRFKTENWVEGGPIIGDDGTIYFGSFDQYLYALHPDGTLKWKYKTNAWIWSTPAIAEDGTIYIGTYEEKLYAINPDGSLKWSFYAGGSISSSPAIAEDGTIYFGTMTGWDKGDIIAINPDGMEKWRYQTDYYIVSDPAIGDDGTIYIGSGDNYLYAMHPDGTLRWRFKTGDWVKSHPSIAEDGTIYISSWDDYLYALYPNGTLKWDYEDCYGGCSSASIDKDGIIYVAGDNKLLAIYQDGTNKWEFDLGSDRGIGHSSPAISADGTIYIGVHIGQTYGGEIIAVNSDGTERWRSDRIADEWVESSPCIGKDGTVYIGSSSISILDDNSLGYLHAFGSGELKAYADGPYYGLIDEPVQFNGDATGGHQPYFWHWDFGDDETSDEQNPTHIYTNPGNYTASLTVTDNEHDISSDIAWIWIQVSNNPPDKPTVDGTTGGKASEYYEYTFTAIDPEENNVYYYVEWGDDTNSGWIGSYNSGEQKTLNHCWDERGTYIIRVKAKDVFDAESNWATLEVSMPKNKIINPFERFLENHPYMFPIMRYFFD
jgi:outer membrane protein assembly factor BamB